MPITFSSGPAKAANYPAEPTLLWPGGHKELELPGVSLEAKGKTDDPTLLIPDTAIALKN